MGLEDLGLIIVSATGGALFIAFIVIYFISNPEKIFSLISSGARLLHSVGREGHRRSVAASITAYLNTAINQFNRESPTVFGQSLRLRWISTEKEFAYLKEGEVVVYVQDSVDQNQVLTHVALHYLKNGVINSSRPYVERRLLNAIDIALAQKMLVKSPGAYEYLQNSYAAELLKDQRDAEFYALAESLEEYGVLTRVVLLELSSLATLLMGKTPNARTREETANFAKFVGRVVNRQDGETPLRFYGKLFSTTLALVAQAERARYSGIDLYKRKFRTDIENGTRTIFLLARGMHNVQLAKGVARWALDGNLVSRILPSSFYQPMETGERLPCECIACFSGKVVTSVELSPIDEVYSALAEIVPEILSGSIEVISIARQKGIRSKIAVRSLSGENPVGYFIGTSGANVEKLKTILDTDEEFDFIPWSLNIEDYISRSLYPLRFNEIAKIDADSIPGQAIVYVTTRDLMRVAIGTRGLNVQLVEQLTGYSIRVEVDPNVKTPEEIAVQILQEEFPDIASGVINIKQLARKSGEMTKVVVESLSLNAPAERCTRLRKTNFRQSKMKELVQFVETSNDPQEQIIKALSINPGEVDSVKIDPERREATVQMATNEEYRSAIGRNGTNVQLANIVTGYRIKITVRN